MAKYVTITQTIPHGSLIKLIAFVVFEFFFCSVESEMMKFSIDRFYIEIIFFVSADFGCLSSLSIQFQNLMTKHIHREPRNARISIYSI